MSLFDEIRKLTQPYDEGEFDEDTQPETDSEPTVVASRRDSAAPMRDDTIRRNPFYAEPETASPAPEARDVVYQREEREAESNRAPSAAAARESVVTIGAEAKLQVVTVKPNRYEQMSAIADHMIAHRTVVVNLEAAPKETARRMVDFLAGATYAVGGEMRKVAINTYIAAPYKIGVLEVLADELENNGVSFY